MVKVNQTEEVAVSSQLTRRDVKPGQIFRKLIHGEPGDTRYVHLASDSGRFYSVNLDSGNLAGSNKGDTRVVVEGTASIVVKNLDLCGGTRSTVDQLSDDSVVRHGGQFFLHLGQLNDGRYAWINMADPFSGESFHANAEGWAEYRLSGTWEINI